MSGRDNSSGKGDWIGINEGIDIMLTAMDLREDRDSLFVCKSLISSLYFSNTSKKDSFSNSI